MVKMGLDLAQMKSHRYWQKAHEATDIIDYLTANFDYVEISPVSNRNLAY